MLLEVLSRTMSSTWQIFWPAVFLTAVPRTFLARIAEVWPDAVVIAISFAFRSAMHRHVMGGAVGGCIGGLRAPLSADVLAAAHILSTME
jgi:hypothetical protein